MTGTDALLQPLVNGDLPEAERRIAEFVSTLTDIKYPVDVASGTRDLPTGVPSYFVDIFPKGLVTNHVSFGIIFVRIWALGRDPKKIMYGIFLGAERAQQTEPRTAALYVRDEIHAAIDPLERERGFHYQVWGDGDIWWKVAGESVRAVTRQLEQFMSFKVVTLTDNDDEEIEADLSALVKAVDTALDLISPIRSFGLKILELYYGANLPALLPPLPAPSDAVSTVMAAGVDWTLARLTTPDLGRLRGLDRQYQQAVSALQAGKHVVLLGPPGTGKTELAETIARNLRQPFDLVTATSDWSTFETIGGYLPMPSEGSTNEPLDFNPGVVTQALDAGHWLIIDELNRADIDKAFGELFTLLSGHTKSVRLPYRKRGEDNVYRQVVLGQSSSANSDQHVYKVPLTWRILATMNTFDKASLFQMSFAFMRRFAFVEVGLPDEEDYAIILSTAADSLLKSDGSGDADEDGEPISSGPGDDFYTQVTPVLNKLFVSREEGTLYDLDLLVGPAIPLDIILYLSRRKETLKVDEDLKAQDLTLEALEMFLYPQFEGRNEKHSEIAQALADALGLAELPKASERQLATWTGDVS